MHCLLLACGSGDYSEDDIVAGDRDGGGEVYCEGNGDCDG